MCVRVCLTSWIPFADISWKHITAHTTETQSILHYCETCFNIDNFMFPFQVSIPGWSLFSMLLRYEANTFPSITYFDQKSSIGLYITIALVLPHGVLFCVFLFWILCSLTYEKHPVLENFRIAIGILFMIMKEFTNNFLKSGSHAGNKASTFWVIYTLSRNT